MAGSPKQQFQQQGREVNTSFCEAIFYFSPVSLVFVGRQDAREQKLTEPRGQYVAGDAFARGLELLKTPVPTYHHVADDEERPAVAKNI